MTLIKICLFIITLCQLYIVISNILFNIGVINTFQRFKEEVWPKMQKIFRTFGIEDEIKTETKKEIN